MSLDLNIVTKAFLKFTMYHVDNVKIKEKKVMIFRSDQQSDINGFIKYFEKYKAQVFYDSHTEYDLYGLIIDE